jgi:hypothetical protein
MPDLPPSRGGDPFRHTTRSVGKVVVSIGVEGR